MTKFHRMTRFAFPYILIVLTLLLVVVGGTAYQTSQAFDEQNAALCHFRDDLAGRVHQSEEIIHNNPHIIKQFGLTKAQLKATLTNQKAALASLGGLDC